MRKNHSSFAKTAQVLRWVKRKAGQGAQRPRTTSLVFGSDGLGRILDHMDSPASGNGLDRIHVGALPEQVHRNDGLGLRRDRFLNPARIDVERRRVDIHKHRPGPQPRHRPRRRKERKRRQNDFVPRPDLQCH